MAPLSASAEGGEGREGPATNPIHIRWIFHPMSYFRLVPEYPSHWLQTTLQDAVVDWIQRQKSDGLTQLAAISTDVSRGPTNDCPACNLRRHITQHKNQ